MGINPQATRHALGIAEYHGPRSPMMRCIDHPTMLKDGSGWGALAGVSAGLLASQGFTGAPAVTVESGRVADIWADLGSQWLITEIYFKPHGVCRWAQPAIEASLKLKREQDLHPTDIRRIRVFTFHEATRLDCRQPQTTEEAQYSLPFPLAAALIHGRLGVKELSGTALGDPQVIALAQRVEMIAEPKYDQRFPAQRLARVHIETKAGESFDSGEVQASWEAHQAPSDEDLRRKFRWLCRAHLPEARAKKLETTLWACQELPDASHIVELLAVPV
jgi:2-methylcitrate dehydratase PrpD